MIKSRKEAELSYTTNMTFDNLLIYQKILAKSRRLFRKKKMMAGKNSVPLFLLLPHLL